MARNLIGNVPFPPVLLFDEDRDFSLSDLHQIMAERADGVSICIRYPIGPEKRGGYFFHIAPSQDMADQFVIYDFEGRPVTTLVSQALIAFMNHCTGRCFDEASFILCQTELNFLKDEEPSA